MSYNQHHKLFSVGKDSFDIKKYDFYMKNEFELRLVSSNLLNNKVKQFDFEIVDPEEFLFIPGQFMSFFLNLEDGTQIKRSYSIANFDEEKNILEFAVTLVQNGVGTTSLCNLKLGEIIKATAPRGKLTFREENIGRHILVGTGTGIVPYKSMLKNIENSLQNSKNSCTIVEGVQNREDMLYVKEFNLLKKYDNFDFKICFSRESDTTNLESYEIRGYVQNYLEKLVLDPVSDTIYLCGNPYMIEDVTNILKNAGFEQDRIVKEQYYAKSK